MQSVLPTIFPEGATFEESPMLEPFNWTPRAMEILQLGIQKGRSYTEIARALSIEFKCHITRDAVSSKANREFRK